MLTPECDRTFTASLPQCFTVRTGHAMWRRCGDRAALCRQRFGTALSLAWCGTPGRVCAVGLLAANCEPTRPAADPSTAKLSCPAAALAAVASRRLNAAGQDVRDADLPGICEARPTGRLSTAAELSVAKACSGAAAL